MNEVWKDIKGYEGLYQVNNLGNVINFKTGKTLKIQFYGRYNYLMLSNKGKTRKNYIHRLIAIAFIDNPLKKECVNHIDGNKLNNNINNLEWCTYSENNYHAMQNKLNQAPRGSKQNFSKLTNNKVLEICKRLENNELPTNICKDYGVSSRSIYDIKLGNTWGWLTNRG